MSTHLNQITEIDDLDILIKQTQAKVKRHETLTPDELQLLDILAFYDSLMLYQQPHQYTHRQWSCEFKLGMIKYSDEKTTKADKTKQEEFIAYYEKLKCNLPKDEVIYFLDASHPQHQTKLAYGWIAKGVRKPEKMTACQKRLNLIAGINLANYHVEYAEAPWINGESIEAFLKQLIESKPTVKKIHVIWDNAGYHKSQAIRNFIKKTNIELHFLPPYSPNLNPIERLWKIMHEKVTYNRNYPKFAEFYGRDSKFF